MRKYQIIRIGNKTSGFRGSSITRMLRGSCSRIRLTRLRLRVRISVLAFASRHPSVPSNSASSSTTFITWFFYKY